jgi:uncharacterized protein YbjT (DUF2867 family)
MGSGAAGPLGSAADVPRRTADSEREKDANMTYVNGGENEIGIALTDSWAAVWTVDTPYIDVLRRDFFDEHADEIRAAAKSGGTFSDENGQTGAVAVISSDFGHIEDDAPFPSKSDDASEYVADELSEWTGSDGGAYEQAAAEGYTY